MTEDLRDSEMCECQPVRVQNDYMHAATCPVAEWEQRHCSCVKKNPLDYDGPDEDCPQHGNPMILGYCPLSQYEEWRRENDRLYAENARLRTELDDALADLSTEQRRKEDALAAIQRVRALAADMHTWCSHRGIATHYAQSIDDALDGPEAGQ